MLSSDYDVIASCTVVASSCSVADSSGLLVRRILWFHWTLMLYGHLVVLLDYRVAVFRVLGS